jgi:putative iron-regulated protein
LGKEILAGSVAKAGDLNTAIGHLLDSPNIENLEQAQRLWRELAAAIERFHLFSRLGTVAPQDFQQLVDLQFNLTAWPIQPGYLDGFGDHPYSGIVFDVGVPMTAEVLREQHGMTDNGDATLGIYAMEFLLFGEQNNRGPLVFQPITALNEKYQEDGYNSVEELPRNRRRELLRLQALLLVEDTARLYAAWISNQPDALRQTFELLTTGQQAELLQKAALALATEQLVVVANQHGVDVWQGQQLADRLIAQLNGLARFSSVMDLGEQVTAATDRSITSLNDIRGLPPLTQQGLPPRVNWQDTYTSLRELIKALNPAPPDQPATSENDM